MAKKPTVADAQLILQLYDLRREAEMRKARNWWVVEFFPESADDLQRVSGAMGSQENAWFRQVLGYWGMATSFVLQGVLNEALFLQPAFSGEMFLIFAKVQPLLKEWRQKLGDAQIMRNVELVATRTKFGRERVQFLAKRVEMMKQKRAERKAS
ncbi:MAG: hypothetical protein DMG77_16915 [Acidobacteria bacterium]|nr:MAG: hypothetical protein DMG77_16915 [Acidobacteriota bacterium]